MLVGLQGCLLINDVVRIPEEKVPAPNSSRAVVIYGIGMESPWEYPRFAVHLDEYSMERHSITGDCWRYNRMEGTVPRDSGVVQYFAFNVAPGYYIYSGFNAVKLAGPNAFLVPEGHVTYLGDFIYSKDGTVIIHRDIEAARNALAKVYGNTGESVILSEAISVPSPKMFLCTP